MFYTAIILNGASYARVTSNYTHPIEHNNRVFVQYTSKHANTFKMRFKRRDCAMRRNVLIMLRTLKKKNYTS